MALKNHLTDQTGLTEAQADLVQDEIITLLKEDAIRGEVYESARFMNGISESFSIVDVHNVLDALVISLEGSSE